MTDPKTIPHDVAKKILAARDALLDGSPRSLQEAYHQLYAIADPEFIRDRPWEDLEAASSSQGQA